MFEYRRKGKLYSIVSLDVTPRAGSDKTIFTYKIKSASETSSFRIFIHFPNCLILQNRLQSRAIREIALKKIQEWLDHGGGESENIYILPEDIPKQEYTPYGISPA